MPIFRTTAIAMSFLFLSYPGARAGQKPGTGSPSSKAEFTWIPVNKMKGYGNVSMALAISRDNSTVYGQYEGVPYINSLTKIRSVWHYFKWTRGKGIKEIPYSQLPPGFAGDKYGYLVEKGFKYDKAWDALLETAKKSIADAGRCYVMDASVNRQTLVGYYDSISINDSNAGTMKVYPYQSFVWSAATGMVDLFPYATTTLGLAEKIKSKSLGRADTISPDGTAIAGEGYPSGAGKDSPSGAWLLIDPDKFSRMKAH